LPVKVITNNDYAAFSHERGADVFSPHDTKYTTLKGLETPSQASDDQLYESDPTLAVLDFEGSEPISGNTPSLSGKVLLLNGNYEPLSICGVQKAIILIYLEKAELVCAAEGKVIRSAMTTMEYPSVVRLSRYIHVPFKKVILSRKNILRRDGHQCQYCGHRSGLTVDHIMPKSRGGEDSWENLTAACLRCNNKKGDRTPSEANMPLRKRPVRPNHVVFLRQYLGRIDKGWEPYLFMH
jgi:5-methylcytosine-specific restriction endonuclease McrA